MIPTQGNGVVARLTISTPIRLDLAIDKPVTLDITPVSINSSKLADLLPNAARAADACISAMLRLARASNIHECFRCNRGYAAAASLNAVARRPVRRARHSFGQHTVSSMPPSRRRLGSESCLAHSSKVACPLGKSPRRGCAPFVTPRRGSPASRLRAPVSHGDCAISPRTVMNNAG